ncbi:unnamed protein product [Fraxinus pennsylvanica]|uniref:BED-type domain-containing protein n=1 Tax=Fraxinus pennsylvanica TaxID=56036 RepID=A0AAD1ZI32_9LAMI|nr:unnamed protein product [Fraxinus pennsylvanica]
MGKNHRTDPAWKYGKEIEKTGGDKKSYVYIECMFCKKTITGGVKRMKEHLACTHKNVAPCPGVPADVKQEIAEYMNAGNMKRQLSQQQFEDMVELGSYYEKNDKEKDSSRGIRGPIDRFVSNMGGDDETHPKMNAAKMKEMRNSVCLDVGRFFFENAIPFNAVESPSFISMCRALGSYGRVLIYMAIRSS